MKAGQLVAPRRMRIVDAPMPSLPDGQALIKVERLSICGSDIHSAFRRVLPEEQYPMKPGRPCHEVVGTVVETRTDAVRKGQRVLVLPNELTGLQEYVAQDPSRMVALPVDADPSEWIACQPVGTVLHAVRRIGDVLGRSVAIIGQGAIGLGFTMIVERLGATKIMVVDPLEYRLAKASEIGATHTINPKKADPVQAVRALTGGRGADIAVDAAGEVETVNEAMAMTRNDGRVALFGLSYEEQLPVNHLELVRRELTLIGMNSARSRDPIEGIRDLIALAERGWAKPWTLITHRMTFNDMQRAYEMYADHTDGVIKLVMTVP